MIHTLGIIAPHPPIMVPDVGHGDADVTRASAAALDTAGTVLERFAPDTVVIMSPHAAGYQDAFGVTRQAALAGDLAQFGAPAVRLETPGDPELADALLDGAAAAGIPAGDRTSGGPTAPLDHGVLVPMHFLDRGHSWPMLLLSFCWLGLDVHRAFGRLVADAATGLGRRVAFVASGDLSHRLKPGAPAGFSPDAHRFDEMLVDAVRRADMDAMLAFDPVLVDDAGECGLRSFVTLSGFLEGRQVSSAVLAYEGPWGVGYLSAVISDRDVIQAITPPIGRKGGVRGSSESAVVRLARDTIERFVSEGAVPDDPALDDPGLPERAGAFVSIHAHGQLRGCIGTIEPTRDTLADEVVHNAVEAATRDPRFPPIAIDELEDLDIKVDVLHGCEAVEGLCDLDPRVYGVVVTCGWRRGLLLPDLEGVDTADQQVDIAMRKAGIVPGEEVAIERFRVDRHE